MNFRSPEASSPPGNTCLIPDEFRPQGLVALDAPRTLRDIEARHPTLRGAKSAMHVIRLRVSGTGRALAPVDEAVASTRSPTRTSTRPWIRPEPIGPVRGVVAGAGVVAMLVAREVHATAKPTKT
ncbi:hypothetical protein GCM10027074_63130 [Streptomyces deserti]